MVNLISTDTYEAVEGRGEIKYNLNKQRNNADVKGTKIYFEKCRLSLKKSRCVETAGFTKAFPQLHENTVVVVETGKFWAEVARLRPDKKENFKTQRNHFLPLL